MEESPKSNSFVLPIIGSNQAFRLDSGGITCPKELVGKKIQSLLEQEGKTSLTIRWADIDGWTGATSSGAVWRMRGSPNPDGDSGFYWDWYIITLNKEYGWLGTNKIPIKRKLLIDHEKEIIGFSQQFLPFKPDPMKATFANSWHIFLIIGFAVIVLSAYFVKCGFALSCN
jgi:hypothetical protein